MAHIWNEEDVSIPTLASHLNDSGLLPTAVQDDEIWLRTSSGISYRITLAERQKFVRLWTYLPLSKTASMEAKLALEHRLNAEVFMPVFSLDDDGDMTVAFVLPYSHGLIAGQFTAIVSRFGSVLDYIVESFNADGIIDFGLSPAPLVPTGAVLN